MNQVLKNLYRLANKEQIDYIAKRCDLLPEEIKVVNMWHKGISDLDIQEEIGLSRNAYELLTEIIETKITLTVFNCIDRCIWCDAK